jgi:hypothetical protein
MMKQKLTMRPGGHFGQGRGLAWDIVWFKVEGLPDREEAKIARSGNGWKLLRLKDGVGDWEGDYDSPEDALAALQSEDS